MSEDDVASSKNISTRRYYCARKLTSHEGYGLDVRISTVKNYLGFKGQKYNAAAYFAIFEAGIEAVEKRMKDEDKLDGKEGLRAMLATRKAQKKEHNADIVALVESRDVLSQTEFETGCNDIGCHPDEIMDLYHAIKIETTYKPPSTSMTENCELFLKYILADGEIHSSETIHYMAKRIGLVKDESHWDLMRQVASRQNYSSKENPGYWQWKIAPI